MSGLYIQKFVDQLTYMESRGQKEFKCSIQDAKRLHADITKLLVDLEALRQGATSNAEVVSLELDGGSF